MPTAAIEAVAKFEACALGWLEEPIPADSTPDDWQRVAAASAIPLAGGENIRGLAAFDRAAASGVFKVIQPDLGKWGGIQRLSCGRAAHARNRRPVLPALARRRHWLGRLISSQGRDRWHRFCRGGRQQNPLREALGRPFPAVQNGGIVLSERPGLGIEPDIARLKDFRVAI